MSTKEEIDALTAFLPRLGAEDFSPVKAWRGGERFCDGQWGNVIEAGHQARLSHHSFYCVAARPASAVFRSVTNPRRSFDYASGLLGRKTPQSQDLTTPRDERVANKAG